MFRRFLLIGAGVLALIGMLAAPGQLYAQRGRGVPHQGFHPTFNRGFNPNIHRTFVPGFGFVPGTGTTLPFMSVPGFPIGVALSLATFP